MLFLRSEFIIPDDMNGKYLLQTVLSCWLCWLLQHEVLQAQLLRQTVHENWQFSKDQQTWYSAIVPGEVHTDLMRHKLIPDPFFGLNEKAVQWVEKEDWVYQTRFVPDPKLMKRQEVALVFDGLDTYADVYLNGHFILRANNMFRQWRVDVKQQLKKGENVLKIHFHSAQNYADSLAKADSPFVIPDHPRAYVRKAPFHFGWDWGPKLTGAGIWRAVRLEGFDQREVQQYSQAPVQVALVERPDEWGQTFYFEIEGKPVYMKGANYIPMDSFVTRPSRADYVRLLSRVKEANMNMLRVWGGGIYERDEFYEICDSLGIYVWQDFMFAGAMVPGDEDFFANVKAEVSYQVERLRHHKSIVLWCGNNEVDEAFNRWGWQKTYQMTAADSARLWKDYTRLFRDSIPHWLKSLDPYRPYISTSPKWGWGLKESFTEGDSHYWGVWWGMEDFEAFEQKTGRFVSEYGMQGMPNYSSVLAFTREEDRYLFSDVLKNHQKANQGFQKINDYLHRYVLDSAQLKQLSVEDYTYASQVLQYYAFKNMILIHRAKAPYNMGTLLWQLNDCWPVASWSIIDHYRQMPKAAWYAVKEAYKEVPDIQRDQIRPKDQSLRAPGIQWKISEGKLVLKAAAAAKYVFLEIEGYTGHLSDNYFDMEPDVEKTIPLDKNLLKHKEPVIKIKTLWDLCP